MKKFKNVVVIAEKREFTNNTTFLSQEIDYSSKKCTNGIIKAISLAGFNCIYYSSPEKFCYNIKRHKNDLIFTTLWGGPHSRNKRGLLSAICEANCINYIGADTYIQLICQDKVLSKTLLKDYIFSIPKYFQINTIKDLEQLYYIDFFPCVIKPINEGCSVGISNNNIVKSPIEAYAVCKQLLKFYSPIMIEEYIDGREISICCAGRQNQMPIILKCLSLSDNLENKYFIWGFESKKFNNGYIPFIKDFTKEFPKKYFEEASRLFQNLGKVDLMRIDGRYRNGKFYVIELSPDCSLGKNDLMHYAFSLSGYSYSGMFKFLIEEVAR